MGRRPLLLGFFLALPLLPAPIGALQHLWSRGFDNPVVLGDVAIDADASTIIVADYFSTPDLGGGPLPDGFLYPNICVAKFDATGQHVWSRGFGSTSGPQWSGSVALDSQGNILLTGVFESNLDFGGGVLDGMTSGGDIYLAKMAPDATHIWSTSFSDSINGSHAADIIVDSEDNVILAGDFCCSMDFGGGTLDTGFSTDVFLAKFDSDGNHLWSQTFPGAGQQTARAVAVDSDDNIVLTGVMANEVDFGGGTLNAGGTADPFLAKFDATGSHLWSQNFTNSDEHVSLDVGTDASGNIFFTGDFESEIDLGGGTLNSAGFRDLFVTKFNPQGTHLWSRRFGDAADQWTNALTVDDAGDVLVTGGGGGVLDFGGGPVQTGATYDGFLFQLNPSGTHLWSRAFGRSEGTALARGPVGNIAIGGIFSDDIDLGGGPLLHVTVDDIFFGRFSATATAAPPSPAPALGLHAWPNPYNPSTQIVLELTSPERVTVRLFDAAGRLVHTLADELPMTAGVHRLPLKLSLASGGDYIEARAGNVVASKKLALIK